MSSKKVILLITLAVLCFCVSVCAAADQWAEIQSSGVIRLGVSSDYIPFVYMEGTQLDGLDIALVNEMAKRLGLSVRTVDIAFDGLVDAAMVGQIDLIGGAFAITESRSQKLDFTNPYYKAGGVIICLAGHEVTQETIRDARLGVMKGTSFEQWVASNLLMGGQISTKNVFAYSKVNDVVNALQNGKVDLILIDEDVYNSQYRNDPSLVVVENKVVDEKYAFAAVKGSTLIPQLNAVMRDMYYDGTSQKIADTYFGKDFSGWIQPSITRPAQAEAPKEVEPEDIAVSREITMDDVTEFTANNAPNCYNGMQFVSDISIPDRTVLLPNMNATKTWNIKNTGTCTWDSSYTFNYVKGSVFGQTSVKINKLVEPGQNYQVSVDFMTPAANGEYTAYWQMRNGSGSNFGQTIWYDFQVNAATGSANQNVHEGTPQIYKFYPDFYSTDQGKCPKVYYEVVNAYQVEFYIDNKLVDTSRNLSGYNYICTPKKPGTYTYAIRAVGENSISTAFTFVNETRYPDPSVGVSADWPHWTR